MYSIGYVKKASPSFKRVLKTFVFSLVFLLSSTSVYAGNNFRNHFEIVNLKSITDGSDTTGAAKLLRNRKTLTADINVTGLNTNSGYTVWWVIYNYPKKCAASPCGFNDLFNPETGAASFYATGFVTGNDDTANVSAKLRNGKLPEGLEAGDLGTGVKPQLNRNRGLKAEIQLVVRHHGALTPGNVNAQIGSFISAPDCCTDQQIAVFPAVNSN